nr:OmpA family protein [Bacteroidota bacterium]
PQPIGPGQVLFTSDRESKDAKDPYLWTGRAYADLYVSNSTSQVTPFSSIINSDANEGTAIFSPDGNTLVFTRCFVAGSYDAWCQLMYSVKKSGGWSEPTAFPFVKEKVNYGHPAFAANGTTLFFSSDMPEGKGGHDIYFTQSDGQGGWSAPENLGSFVNTLGQEQYPTVYNDTLYYSSDHLAGLGGMDIFKTFLDSKNQWVAPINLRAPINSGADDFGYVVDTFATLRTGELVKGYFTSSRGGASRNDDIYAFTYKGILPGKDVVTKTDEEKETEVPMIQYQIYLALRVMEPIFEIPDDPNSREVGKRPLPNGPVIMSQGLMDERFVTDDKGYILLKLELDKKYTLTARYRDHLSETYSINTSELEKTPFQPIITVNQILILDPIFKNKEIVLENIFYDYEQWFIRDDAKPSLNDLSNIMKANPSIKIQLSSHTDCRGTDEYNQELSQRRAQAAIEYLMSVGIPARRLVAQGFGESSLAVKCACETCTEEQHQQNRRTTFKIID